MKKKFITNLALLLFLNLLIKPFWIFGIDLEVQNRVGANDYGLYISLFNFSLLLNVILDLGITNYNNRKISQNHSLISKYFSSIVAIKFLLAFAYAAVSFGLAFLIGYDTIQLHLLSFLVGNQFLISFTLYLRSNISGLQLFRTDSLLSVLDKSLMLILMGILLYGNVSDKPFDIHWFVYAQTAAYAATFLVVLLIVSVKGRVFHLRFDRKLMQKVLLESWPYALLVLLMASYQWIGMVMLERMLDNGKTEAGIYAQGNRLLEAVSQFGFLFAALLLPMFSKMIQKKESIHELLRLSSLLLLVPAILLAITGICFDEEIMLALYHEIHPGTTIIFTLLMNSFLGIGLVYVFGSLLTANGSLKNLSKIAFVGLVINVGLNLWLIPQYQAVGMAIASLCTQLVMGFLHVWLAKKTFLLKTDYKTLIRLSLFFAILLILAPISKTISSYWLVNLVLLLIGGLFIAFFLRLFSLKALFQILRGNE